MSSVEDVLILTQPVARSLHQPCQIRVYVMLWYHFCIYVAAGAFLGAQA